MLTALTANADALLAGLGDDAHRRRAEQIQIAAERAVKLAEQLGGAGRPRPELARPAAPRPARVHAPRLKEGTVLVVDGEDLVREVASAMLQRNGVRVLTATNGDEAVDVARRADRVDAAVLDLTVRGLPVATLAATLRSLWPSVKLVVSSGHSVPAGEGLVPGAPFIRKPYTSAQLLEALA